MLAMAASVALAAEFVAGQPGAIARTTAAGRADLDSFLAPIRHEAAAPRFEPRVASDPLAAPARIRQSAVAPRVGRPTVSASGRDARRLTAILIADDRSVAVLDDIVVGVGDRLPDGSRVAAIQADRVSVVERNGRRRVLTLRAGR